MSITAVCLLILIKLRWPKNKSIYDEEMICSGLRYPNSTQPVYSPDILQYQVIYMIWLQYYGHLAKFGHGYCPSSRLIPFVSISGSFDLAMGSLAQLLLHKIRTRLIPFVSISGSFDLAMGSLAQLLLQKIRTMAPPNTPQSNS